MSYDEDRIESIARRGPRLWWQDQTIHEFRDHVANAKMNLVQLMTLSTEIAEIKSSIVAQLSRPGELERDPRWFRKAEYALKLISEKHNHVKTLLAKINQEVISARRVRRASELREIRTLAERGGLRDALVKLVDYLMSDET